MKVIILHGDDKDRIQKRLDAFKKSAKNRDWEVLDIDASDKKFIDQIRNSNLFNPKRLILLHNPQKITKDYSSQIMDSNDDSTLVVYSYTKIASSTIKLITKTFEEEKFEIVQSLWNFIDTFYPGNPKNQYLLLQRALEKDAPEFIFIMLAKRVKDLYVLKTNPNKSNLSPWMAKKMQNQAQKFDHESLRSIVQEFASMDIEIKKGKISTIDCLDFMISKYLQ